MLLVFTSTFFATNVVMGLWLKHYLYAALFALLTCTSVLHHSSYGSDTVKTVDRFACLSVVAYGAYQATGMFDSLTLPNVILLACFLFCVVAYEYGGRTQQYCFDANPFIATCYHAWMHLCGSVGHHFIMLQS